jgi:hypothetical protein
VEIKVRPMEDGEEGLKRLVVMIVIGESNLKV